jgi:two-component system, NtrC family, response regulator HydG
VGQVAPSSATLLILGESGTGKEVIAEAVHRLSPRAGKPLVKVNCAALPEALLESELFGYEKGAFTGALARKEGRFEIADGGTLFLDEIGDLSPVTQVKLLRVLQEGEFERVGGTRTVKVDVRLVAATHRDLPQAVREKKFREDLYYRINVITIQLPPLRERREDIPLLARHFLDLYRRRNGKSTDGFAPEAMKALLEHPWPGNVRELENVVERAVVLCRRSTIGIEDLPKELGGGGEPPLGEALTVPLGVPLEEVERRLIEETLRRTKGDKNLAARLLGVASRTIYRKLKGKP